jgi:hypothetical protein
MTCDGSSLPPTNETGGVVITGTLYTTLDNYERRERKKKCGMKESSRSVTF